MAHVALVTTLLRRTDLFRSLSEADRSAVASQMREAKYEPGRLIFSRGDPGEAMHLVVEGRVRLSVLSVEGRSLSFGHASRGDIFGEIAVLDGLARTADATALTQVTTMVLARASLRHLMEARPHLAQAAVTFVCHRLRTTNDQVEAIALHSIEVRLARFLLTTVGLRGQGKAGTQPVALDLGMSQGELALLIGASRSKVSAALAVLEKEGAIHHTASHIECNVGVLQHVAQGD
jgi:CRP/FNR family transcriptional regulator, cyclic AMP receptor protein